MRGISLAVYAAALGACASAAAQVYKCAGDRGTPVYQDAPCPSGRELRNFAADPPAVSVLPMQPAPGTTMRAVAPPASRAKASAERKARVRGGDPADRRHIRPGMHEGEVLARIGAPDMKSGGGGRKVARWTYLPDPGDPQTLTTVVLETGRVVEVERKVMR
ncbi:MAG: DUF4124 domain-containing protein [Burkholderiales bacterium]